MKGKVFIFLTILMMGTIFFFSSEDSKASNERSDKIISVVDSVSDSVDTTQTETSNIEVSHKDNYKMLNFTIRKGAHFIVYMLLGIFFFMSIYSLGVSKGKAFLIMIIFCFLYACSDEYHQSFTGRTSSFSDVLLDTMGALVGCIMILTIHKVWMFLCKKEYLNNKK